MHGSWRSLVSPRTLYEAISVNATELTDLQRQFKHSNFSIETKQSYCFGEERTEKQRQQLLWERSGEKYDRPVLKKVE